MAKAEPDSGVTGDLPGNVEINKADSCGDNVTWAYDETNKTLTISGSGDMADYTTNAPWKDKMSQIQTVVIGEGKTTLYDNEDQEVASGSNLIINNKLTYYWVTPLSNGTVIYKGEKAAFTKDMYFFKIQTDGQAGSDSSKWYYGGLYTLNDISYNEGGYKFKFIAGYDDEETIKIESNELSPTPGGLEVVSGDGTQDSPFVFKMIPSIPEVTAAQPQVMKAGDRFKVGGDVDSIMLNN